MKAFHWAPFAFCAFLSALVLFFPRLSQSGAWMPVFFCFLPMCFFFVGAATVQMQKEIRELRNELADLRQNSGK
ncbi:MAG TPA: hypothetical protein VK850_06195 [Candidatus Binatia bacterium]|nr:hypothetical protein [Candidatus Binatia bacterium]